VLTANGRVGGPFRTVRVGTSDALDLSMAAPPAGPVPSIFALYAWREVPEGIATLPQPYGIGFACLPTPLDLREPAPSVIWNNTPRPRLGRPDFPSTPAPSTVLSLPAGVGFEVDVTFQGIILDFGSAASVPASLTNAIVLEVRD